MAKRLIARAWLGGSGEPARLGRFTLRPGQRELCERVRAALREFGTALVADPPGSGKTVVALAIARAYDDVLIAAPAMLRDQWTRAAARAEVRIRFVSLETLSRGREPTPAPLLVIDEAHHARTPHTARYAVLRRLAARAHTLLLTATPVVNRAADRDALLALALAERASRLGTDELARCVLRSGAAAAPVPVVRRLAPLEIDAVRDAGEAGDASDRGTLAREIAARLHALPSPLALSGGNDATALIRMSLALAWSSSLAALDHALRRRVQRGEALCDLLRSGHAPTRAALRHWVLVEDTTQLAFAELVGAPVEAARGRAEGAVLSPAEAGRQLDVLTAHLAAVQAFRRVLRPHRDADAAARANAIRTLAAAHPERRIVVFARHAETIRVLWAAMRTDAGIVAITGARVQAAAGRWHREEVLAALGPRARALDPHDPRAIRILLATDLLAEGVELPAAGLLVHADLPWTPSRLAQRRGRLARPGGRHAYILETRFAVPSEAREIVRIGSRLRRKQRAGRAAIRPAEAPERLVTLMRRWTRSPVCSRIATGCASVEGFVGAVRSGPEVLLVAGRRARDGSWRLGLDPPFILRTCQSAQGVTSSAEANAVTRARRLIARALARRAARALLGGTALRTGDAVARSARQLERELACARPLERAHHADALRRLFQDQRIATDAAASATPRLIALLLLRSAALPATGAPAAGPSSASPDIAAPR